MGIDTTVKTAAGLVAEYDVWENEATAELDELNREAEETSDYGKFKKRRTDFAMLAWEKLGALAEAVRCEQQQTAQLQDALKRMGNMLATSDGALGHLTCTEFQPIAEVLVLAGHREEARRAILGHGSGDDDEWDHHHDLYRDGDPGIAEKYLVAIERAEPAMKWRNLWADGHVAGYHTQAARDDSAAHIAQAWKCDVTTEVWVEELDRDWWCDGVIRHVAA